MLRRLIDEQHCLDLAEDLHTLIDGSIISSTLHFHKEEERNRIQQKALLFPQKLLSQRTSPLVN